MGNVSVKHKHSYKHRNNKHRNNKHSYKRSNNKHRHSKRSGGMRSPPKEDASPRTVIRQKMRDSVTRRKKEALANSETPFGSRVTNTRTRRKKTPPKETILEEAEW